jgi:DNA uptake protein ComE-like DNA-binding protein
LSFSRTDLQTARVEDLMEVPGVGRVTAEKIVRFREEYGLREFDDLLEIPGLRRAQFLGLKGRFTLSPAPKP